MPLELSSPAEQAYIRGLIFGPGGYGKTTLLGTAQEDERTFPMCLITFNENVDSLLGLDIDVLNCHTWDDLSEAFGLLGRGELTSQLHGKPFKSVGFDSITELNWYALMAEVARKEPHRRNKGDDPNYPQIQDYGIILTQMQRFVREWNRLPMHVFYTAGSDSEVAPGEGSVTIPLMYGQMKHKINSLMTFVSYISIVGDSLEDSRRTLLLHSIPKFRVRVNTPWKIRNVPQEIEDPTMTKVLDYILPKKLAVVRKQTA